MAAGVVVWSLGHRPRVGDATVLGPQGAENGGLSALAEFERRLIQERTRAGLSAGRARGRNGGRSPIPVDHPSVVTCTPAATPPVADTCRTHGTSRPTLYGYLARM